MANREDQQFNSEMAAIEIKQQVGIARAEIIRDAIAGALILVPYPETVGPGSPEVEAALLMILSSAGDLNVIADDEIGALVDIHRPLRIALMAAWRLANANVESCVTRADPSIDGDSPTYI